MKISIFNDMKYNRRSYKFEFKGSWEEKQDSILNNLNATTVIF